MQPLFRIRFTVLILWFPIWLLVLACLNLYASSDLHGAVLSFFGPSTFIMLFLQATFIQKLLQKAEFWIVIVSIFLAAVGLEIALRVGILKGDEPLNQISKSTHPENWHFLPDFYAGFSVNPDWETNEGDMVNELGFRGEEIALPKPDGIFRIVAIGGSTTYGTGVARWQDSYPEQLEQVLREEYGYSNIEVINAGQPDYNSWESLINLEFRVLELEPDLIIYYEATNDAHSRFVAPDRYHSDNSGRRHPWDYEEYRSGLNWVWQVPSRLLHEIIFVTGIVKLPSPDLNLYISQDCTGPSATPECIGMPLEEVLEANPPIYYERNIRSMIAVAEANDSAVLLLTWAYSPNLGDYASTEVYQLAFEQHNEVMRLIAQDTGVFFYDFAPDMPDDIQYWTDGRHTNVEGSRLQAELIAAYMAAAEILPSPAD